MSNKTNEILTIAGERVEKRYSAKAGDCCYRCCFWSDAYGMCRAERADSTPPCQDYDSKEGGFAYFVPAKEIEGNPQEVTLIPSNEDADKAAEKYAAEQTPVEFPNLFGEDAIKSAYAAGMLAERERMMKGAVGCMFSFTEDKTPCLLIGDGYALRVNAKKGDYFVAIIIKKEK